MATKKKAAPKKAAKKPRVVKTLAQQYAKLFPVTKNITKGIIEKADIWDGAVCIGARTLKAALGAKLKADDLTNTAIWGCTDGQLRFTDGSDLIITTKEGIDLTDVVKPQSVTFIVKTVR